jgi:hypothetical protein
MHDFDRTIEEISGFIAMPRPPNRTPRLEWRRGSWSILYYQSGNRRRIATGTTDEKGARRFLADFEAQQDRAPRQLTVSEALDRYERDRENKVVAMQRLREAGKALRRDIDFLRVNQVTQLHFDRYTAGRVT